jgi:hypothetical protein
MTHLHGNAKSSTSALRYIPCHCDVQTERLIPRDLRALNLKPFALPSDAVFSVQYSEAYLNITGETVIQALGFFLTVAGRFRYTRPGAYEA